MASGIVLFALARVGGSVARRRGVIETAIIMLKQLRLAIRRPNGSGPEKRGEEHAKHRSHLQSAEADEALRP